MSTQKLAGREGANQAHGVVRGIMDGYFVSAIRGTSNNLAYNLVYNTVRVLCEHTAKQEEYFVRLPSSHDA